MKNICKTSSARVRRHFSRIRINDTGKSHTLFPARIALVVLPLLDC